MVSNGNQATRCRPVDQGFRAVNPEANTIGGSTPYDLGARYLTAYGGLLPVAMMWESERIWGY
jgi:hypothetical protein